MSEGLSAVCVASRLRFLRYRLDAAELKLRIQRPRKHLHDGLVQVIFVPLKDGSPPRSDRTTWSGAGIPPTALRWVWGEVGDSFLQRRRQLAL